MEAPVQFTTVGRTVLLPDILFKQQVTRMGRDLNGSKGNGLRGGWRPVAGSCGRGN
jgi:hypothetical protein